MSKKPLVKSSSTFPVFAIIVERTVRLQHVLSVSAPDVDIALELAEDLVARMDDSEFDWRENSHDLWSAFGRRDQGAT
jgi:1,2-phenylacetyl-CoA epoxidase PaaB subunit